VSRNVLRGSKAVVPGSGNDGLVSREGDREKGNAVPEERKDVLGYRDVVLGWRKYFSFDKKTVPGRKK
jgi:hypothetical protein